ncbi:MAG TPA: hypothetical protein VEI96_10580 [Thermodesulfovibrionales bacterium]|nr:hypothetical protein [Thermodesulfovibrionales bacterium]
MNRKSLVLFMCCSLFLSMLVFGCGSSGPGQPGSTGSEDTGVTAEITAVPFYNGAATYSVDVVQQVCEAGPPPVFEFFADHLATVTFTVSPINNRSTFQLGTLFVDYYTIDYRRSNDSIGAPPIESDTVFNTIAIAPPTTPASAGATAVTTATLILVDLTRKFKYLSDIQSGQYTTNILNNYTATYTFVGHNEFGKSFTWQTQTNFQIGSFNYCG